MKPPIIIATSDYSQFKLHSSNRILNQTLLKKLIDSISIKNFLHLFPIVVNADKIVIEGQHRLAAAKELKLEIYYIVDNSISQLDIAMVNNNRKQWGVRDYIHFHAQEGNKPMQDLKWLLQKYPKCTVIGGVKLMRADTKRYWEKVTSIGGGNDSQMLRMGKISNDDFDNAKLICEIAQSILAKVPYIFRADLLLDLKKLVVENSLSKKSCIEKLQLNAKLFPKNSNYYDVAATRVLQNILINAGKSA